MCMYCQAQVSPERIEAGYAYCMASECVSKGLRDRRNGFRLVLMPKQGFTYVSVDSLDLHNGRSSGRQDLPPFFLLLQPVRDTQLGYLRPPRWQSRDAFRCVSPTLYKKGKTMFGWFIGSLLVLWLVITLINKQYEIDQEDWDFREEGE